MLSISHQNHHTALRGVVSFCFFAQSLKETLVLIWKCGRKCGNCSPHIKQAATRDVFCINVLPLECKFILMGLEFNLGGCLWTQW